MMIGGGFKQLRVVALLLARGSVGESEDGVCDNHDSLLGVFVRVLVSMECVSWRVSSELSKLWLLRWEMMRQLVFWSNIVAVWQTG